MARIVVERDAERREKTGGLIRESMAEDALPSARRANRSASP
jgi:hypothetical protein